MLKHCQSSSVRLQRRFNPQPDSVSLHSNVTLQSNGDSSDSSFNSSFNMNHNDQTEIFNVRNALFDRSLYPCATPDPISLSSRTSSYASLAETGPRTTIKVFASCLRPDIEYKTLGVGNSTTARDVIWQLLSKYRMKHRDPKLFFLSMEVTIQKPGRDGLTKKTLVLEEEAKPAELKNCNPWGECRFTLQMRKGGLVKVHDSVLMEESQYKCLLISEDTSVDDVIKILLFCYGLEKVERSERYCMYEHCSTQRYQRRLSPDDRPLQIQALWPGPTPFSFVLKRSPARIEDNVWTKQRTEKLAEKTNGSSETRERQGERSWPVVTEWSTQTEDRLSGHSSAQSERSSGSRFSGPGSRDSSGPSSRDSSGPGSRDSSGPGSRESSSSRFTSSENLGSSRFSSTEIQGSENSTLRFPGAENHLKSRFPSCSRIFREEDESWPELDKDSEEHVSSGEDMDTSLSSNDSPTPPLTSTPLSLSTRISIKAQPLSKPTMSFLYPSPEYESFPHRLVPSRPYSSLSSSSQSLSHTLAPAPSLPPKPTSLVSLFSKNSSSSGFHDYENYFYI